jgi:hypothetical protein
MRGFFITYIRLSEIVGGCLLDKSAHTTLKAKAYLSEKGFRKISLE